MPTVTRSAEVRKAQARIFDYLEAGENVREWMPDVERADRLTSGPVQPGSRFRYVLHVLGRRFEIINEVTDLDRPRLVGFRAVSGIGNGGQFEIAPGRKTAPTQDNAPSTGDGQIAARSELILRWSFDIPSGPIGFLIRTLPVASIIDHYAQVALRNLVARLESLPD